MSTKSRDMLRREKMDTTLPTLVEMFAATKLTEGKARKTVDWYVWMMGKYIAYVGADATLKRFDLTSARSFVASLQAKESRYEHHPISPEKKGGLSAYTIHGYVRSLKAFSAWLYEEGFTTTDVLTKLKRPKLPQTMIEVLTDAEIERITEAINPNTYLGARLYTIVLLLLDTGIRADELLGLTLENTDVEGGKLKVLGKGNKERMVPFANGTRKALIRYLNTWRPETDSNLVFVSTDTGDELSYTALAHALKRLGQKAGVPRLRAHLFRHSFSVRYLMNGGDLASLRLILGHCDISTTQQYLKLSQVQIEAQHFKFSPVDRLGIGNGKKKGKR